MMHCVLVVRPAIQADRWDNATDTNRSFHSSLHENTDNNACKMWHDLISSLPFSKVSSSFLWIGLCAATVLGTTRGTLLSGRAACFWNNELDKKPNNSVFDSLTAKTLPLDRGHPHAAAVCLLETKGIEAIVGNSSQRRSVKANGNMTPRVKRYYFLYFSPPRHCSDVPGHFATRRSIICRGRPHLVYVVMGEAAFLWHGTARPELSHPVTPLQGRQAWGSREIEVQRNGALSSSSPGTQKSQWSILCCFLVLFLFFCMAFVNYSPFPALSSRPRVRRHKRQGERKLAVPWVWCFEIPYQEMWTWSEPKKAPKHSHFYSLQRKTVTTRTSAGNVCILTLIEGEKCIDF